MTDDEFRDRVVQATADYMLERFFKVNARPEAFYVECCFALAARAAAIHLLNLEDPAPAVMAFVDAFKEELHAHILAAAADAEALPPPAARPRLVH